MKKLRAILLVMLLTVPLCTGCAAQISNELVGTWGYRWVLSEEEGLALGVTMKVNGDGTFALTVDAGALLDKLDEITQKMENAGQDASAGLEQALGKTGMDTDTVQSLLKLLFPKDKVDDGERKDTATIEGRCKTEDGKLYLSLVKVVGIYGDTYLLYTVADGALSLSLPEDESSEISKMLGALFPLTLQKTE